MLIFEYRLNWELLVESCTDAQPWLFWMLVTPISSAVTSKLEKNDFSFKKHDTLLLNTVYMGC